MSDEIYVDKTELIYELASKKGWYLLVRPRRFGKSLLISTFESLFKYGLRDFGGLAIEELWKAEAKHLVVKLDFSEVKYFSSLEVFLKKLTSLLSRSFSFAGFQYLPDSKESICDQLSEWLNTLDTNSLVVLVDEYDAPLTSCLEQEELFLSVREQLSKFYAVLDTYERVLRFVFVTGIIRSNETCPFSESGRFMDLSLDPRFGSLVGFTQNEFEDYFACYIDRAAAELSMRRDDLLKQVVAQYGGYCFEKRGRTKVLAPWSVLNFFAQPSRGFRAYWFETGGTALLLKYLKTDAVKIPEEFSKEKRISLPELGGTSGSLSDIALLTQAGYLTIKAKEPEETFLLDYPNLEVRHSLAQLYTQQLLDGKVPGQVGAGPIAAALRDRSAESVVHVLNRFFLAIDSQKYPVEDEAALRAYVQVYFAAAGLDVTEGCQGANGRNELMVRVGRRPWLFDFSIVHTLRNESEQNVDAAERMGNKHPSDQKASKDAQKVMLVFSIEARHFVKWREF